jgi:metallo-beta-lactamase class B
MIIRFGRKILMSFTRRLLTILLAISAILALSSCNKKIDAPKKTEMTKPTESFLKYGETNETIVELSKVNNSVWVHTSYYEVDGALVPSNGLVVVTDNGLVLIDTTRTEKQMISLDKLVHQSFNADFKEAIITRAHPDSLGGASYLIKKNIPISSLEVVAKTAERKGFVVPDKVESGDSATINIDGTEFEIYYPGAGYSLDNTVVWIGKDKILYGGCLIKDYSSTSPGDVTGIDIKNWQDSLKAVQEKYPDIEAVIPDHGQWGDAGLIEYTLSLLEE